MNCAEVRPHLSAYHDGELDARLRSVVAAHVAGCPACRAYLDELAELSQGLRVGRQGELPPGIWERIAAAASCPPQRTLRSAWLVRVGAIAAGFVLYLLAHELAAASVPGSGAPPSTSFPPVEQVLRDAAGVLAGQQLADDRLAALTQRPEVLLVHELTEEPVP